MRAEEDAAAAELARLEAEAIEAEEATKKAELRKFPAWVRRLTPLWDTSNDAEVCRRDSTATAHTSTQQLRIARPHDADITCSNLVARFQSLYKHIADHCGATEECDQTTARRSATGSREDCCCALCWVSTRRARVGAWRHSVAAAASAAAAATGAAAAATGAAAAAAAAGSGCSPRRQHVQRRHGSLVASWLADGWRRRARSECRGATEQAARE